MSCSEPRELLHAHLDGELGLAESVEMEAHLSACGTCAAAYEDARRLRSRFAGKELSFRPPAAFERRIRNAIGEEAKSPRRFAMLFPRWTWIAAPAVAAAALWLAIVPPVTRTADTPVEEIVSSHVRSLLVDHLTDVGSSDTHTVKPWFDGKLDFSPPVVDFADLGFPLIGGRLDYLSGRPVAALVYGRHKHFINLFVWPGGGGGSVGEQVLSRRGFNLVHWSSSGMAYWLISDLNEGELGELAALVRERAVRQAGAPPSP